MESYDSVFVKDLSARGIIGVYDWERQEKQEILVNAEIFGNLQAAGESDSIEDTINYHALALKILAYIESSQHYTVEALAENLAKLCLLEPLAVGVRIRVEKPGAVRFAASVGVEIERKRSEPQKGPDHKE